MYGLTNAVLSRYTEKKQRRFCDEARTMPEQANSFYSHPRHEDKREETVEVFFVPIHKKKKGKS